MCGRARDGGDVGYGQILFVVCAVVVELPDGVMVASQAVNQMRVSEGAGAQKG